MTINQYYSPITFLSYTYHNKTINEYIKEVYTEDILNELISCTRQDSIMYFNLMESIINTLDTELWFKYISLLSSLKYSTDIKIFINTVGIYLLKLNPCPLYYKGTDIHVKFLMELDDDIIDVIKPEFMRLFGIQFKNILKNDAKKFQHLENPIVLSKNIDNIFK